LSFAVSAKSSDTSPDSTGVGTVAASSAKAAVEIAIAATAVINTLRIILLSFKFLVCFT
jgi:hypothetical protein